MQVGQYHSESLICQMFTECLQVAFMNAEDVARHNYGFCGVRRPNLVDFHFELVAQIPSLHHPRLEGITITIKMRSGIVVHAGVAFFLVDSDVIERKIFHKRILIKVCKTPKTPLRWSVRFFS